MIKIEKETIINFNDEELEASIYSCQPSIWRECEKLGLKPKNIKTNQKGDVTLKGYHCPKKWIKIRKPRALSEEERKNRRAIT